ncbi:hypothetical protein C477_07026 [Haloterrigena salina JCM 13891]|uniref:DUF5305 domain-containing protein n=1 Tax=Haloterrigena salina JCM 13891 TaxID=1227488 RepID=M0CA34_9EURY|nr:DUF5305 domain-containing protein [Haloterrigena salina]ELZ20151.1 hypothetical protein C477_07026 [Haloterrigena salina JCM 13891]
MVSLLTDADGDETGRERRLRLRALFAEYRTVLLIAFVVLIGLGAWLSYGAYATSETATEQQPGHRWTATGEFSHGAVVTESNPVHPDGTRLENESLYYEGIAPTVDGEFVGGYDAGGGEDVRVSVAVDLVYRSVDPNGDGVYWSRREELESATATDVAPGEGVTASFAVNVTAVRESIAEIEREVGTGPGETEIVLDLERTVDGRIDGERRSANHSYEVPITTDGKAYRLEADGSYDEPREEYESVEVPVSAGPLRSVGGPLLLGLGAVGIGAVAVVTRRFPELTETEREWLAYRADRSEFEEVITTVSLPASELAEPRATVDSLAALARLGIDLEAAVLFDSDENRYVVRGDGVRYVFEPPRPPTGDDLLAPVTMGADSTADDDTDTGREGLAVGEADGSAASPTDSDTGSAPVTVPDGRDADSDRSARRETTGNAVEPTEPAVESAARAPRGRSSETTREPPIESPAESSEPASDSTAGIDDEELLALAGLEPRDLSEPPLFESTGGGDEERADRSEGGPDH